MSALWPKSSIFISYPTACSGCRASASSAFASAAAAAKPTASISPPSTGCRRSPPSRCRRGTRGCRSCWKNVLPQLGEVYEGFEMRLDDAAWVGHRLAEILPIPLADKQACLELDDPIQRLDVLAPLA